MITYNLKVESISEGLGTTSFGNFLHNYLSVNLKECHHHNKNGKHLNLLHIKLFQSNR